jgi:hypothetical protein
MEKKAMNHRRLEILENGIETSQQGMAAYILHSLTDKELADLIAAAGNSTLYFELWQKALNRIFQNE